MLRIVAPEMVPEISDGFEGEHDLRLKNYEPDDLEGSFIVVAATDDKKLNSRIADDCRKRGIIINAVDQQPDCDFFVPAIVRRGDISIAISTEGKSPALSKWLKGEIESKLSHRLGKGLEIISDVREHLMERNPGCADIHGESFRAFFESDIWNRFLEGSRDLNVEEVIEWILSSTD